MSKSSRKEKLERLRSLAQTQNKEKRLIQEKKINLLQSKMLEQEFLKMQEKLEELHKRRDELTQARQVNEANRSQENQENLNARRELLRSKRDKLLADQTEENSD